MLQPRDLESLGLPPGELRLLQRVVAVISPKAVQGTSATGVVPQDPVMTESPKTGTTLGDSAAASTVEKPDAIRNWEKKVRKQIISRSETISLSLKMCR